MAKNATTGLNDMTQYTNQARKFEVYTLMLVSMIDIAEVESKRGVE
jgi:hypothetical protein